MRNVEFGMRNQKKDWTQINADFQDMNGKPKIYRPPMNPNMQNRIQNKGKKSFYLDLRLSAKICVPID